MGSTQKKIISQIVLTSAESKKLIAKAVVQLREVQRSVREGILALHPSSSTVFILEEIIGKIPKGLWVCGVVTPKGLCMSLEAPESKEERTLGSFIYTWIIQKRKLQDSVELGLLLGKMGPDDVYIKGANALDPKGNAGVLFANPAGGSIGKVMKVARERKFKIIIPIGLEKLIPVSISEAAKKAGFRKVNKAMGLPCGLIPINGKVITEIDAIKILTGATATPIAAGGLKGAEGAIVLSIEGSQKEIDTLQEKIKEIKGAVLPKLNLKSCSKCRLSVCHFRKTRPFWAQ